MESVLRGHPESCMPFCVREWQILDLASQHESGEPDILYHETDNHSARREITLARSVRTSSLGVRVLSTHGGEVVRGGIFEIRAYTE